MIRQSLSGLEIMRYFNILERDRTQTGFRCC
jgi:hypothetical protein